MCRYRSGEAVFDPITHTVRLYTIDGHDSHNNIRQEHHIPEAQNGLMDRYHTPVEYVPTACFNREEPWTGWDLFWDAGKPDWADENVSAEIIRQFKQVIISDDLERWDGSLDLSSLTSMPAGVTLSAGGSLYLRELTSMPEGVTISAGEIKWRR